MLTMYRFTLHAGASGVRLKQNLGLIPFLVALSAGFAVPAAAGPVPGNPPSAPSGAVDISLGDRVVGLVTEKDFREPNTRVGQISTGANGQPAVYDIWTERQAGGNSRKIGPLVVTGTQAPRGYSPYTEHFIWFDAQVTWLPKFYLHLVTRAPDSEVIAAAKKVDQFNNHIKCNPVAKATPTSNRWKATIRTPGSELSDAVHVASLVKGTDLLGYWVKDANSAAIAQGPDGWIDLTTPPVVFRAKSWGTPP